MKNSIKLTNLLAGFSLFLSTFALSDTLTQSASDVFVHYSPLLHELGFDSTETNSITVKRVWDENDRLYKLTHLKIDFEDTNDISTSNLRELDPGRRYETVVSVFGLKDVNMMIEFEPQETTSIRIQASLAKGMPGYSDYMPNYIHVFDFGTPLFYAGPLKTADIESIKANDKTLSFRLYQHYGLSVENPSPSGGFTILMNWYGYGEREVYIEAPSHPETGLVKAVGILIQDSPAQAPDAITGKEIVVEYEIEGSKFLSFPKNIDDILRSHYSDLPVSAP
ncbi:MAG: hypothetical protein OXE99_03395 [Cellvibrionales bacterium]|nr:hypothetical protein [Cellvibrionales bacterium]